MRDRGNRPRAVGKVTADTRPAFGAMRSEDPGAQIRLGSSELRRRRRPDHTDHPRRLGESFIESSGAFSEAVEGSREPPTPPSEGPPTSQNGSSPARRGAVPSLARIREARLPASLAPGTQPRLHRAARPLVSYRARPGPSESRQGSPLRPPYGSRWGGLVLRCHGPARGDGNRLFPTRTSSGAPSKDRERRGSVG